MFGGFPIEHYVFDSAALSAMFEQQRDGMGALLVSGILTGNLIFDRDNASEDIRMLAEEASRLSGDLAPTSSVLQDARATATTLMIELATNHSVEENIFYGTKLYDQLTNLLVRQNAGCYYGYKFKWRRLYEFEAQLAQDFHDAFVELVATGRRDNFLHICEVALDRLGGPLWDGHRRSLPRFRQRLRQAWPDG